MAHTPKRQSVNSSVLKVDTLPCRTFEDIFESLDEERATKGVVPVENSLAGNINLTYDLLLDHDFRVQRGDTFACAAQLAGVAGKRRKD